jgi:Ribbon-helix-helix protein, copG family
MMRAKVPAAGGQILPDLTRALCGMSVRVPDVAVRWKKILARTVIPSYTGAVKTAISLPEDTFEQATKQAAELGISRSEFFARAARRYLDDLAARSLTQQIDEALQAAGPDDSATAAAAAGRSRLARQDDW